MTSRSVTVRGRVEDVYFSSPGFSAGCLRGEDGKRVKFAGPVLLQEHEPVVLRGRWETHPKYGRQLQVESVELDLDLDPEGLAHYLAHHPAIKGIGPAKARRIALRFGADFERVLTEEPHLIAEEARIPVEAVEALRDEWLRTRTVNAALVWLSTYGLTHHQVTTLVEKYGNNVVAILKADPYLIVREIPGFGFRRVDQIALQVGTPKEHPSRLRAGVLFCVRDRLEQGDCWVGYEQLVEAANEVLALDSLGSRELIEHTLEGLISAGELSCASYAGRFLVAIPEIRRMEEELGTIFSSGTPLRRTVPRDGCAWTSMGASMRTRWPIRRRPRCRRGTASGKRACRPIWSAPVVARAGTSGASAIRRCRPTLRAQWRERSSPRR